MAEAACDSGQKDVMSSAGRGCKTMDCCCRWVDLLIFASYRDVGEGLTVAGINSKV